MVSKMVACCTVRSNGRRRQKQDDETDRRRGERAAEELKRMLILGGGIIGLEMGTVYSTLGARLDVVQMMDGLMQGLMQGVDRDLVKVWQKMNAKRFYLQLLKTKTVSARALPKAWKSLSRVPNPARMDATQALRPPHQRCTTSCCKPWAARPTAKNSLLKKQAWQ
jgi:hypothetical protein